MGPDGVLVECDRSVLTVIPTGPPEVELAPIIMPFNVTVMILPAEIKLKTTVRTTQLIPVAPLLTIVDGSEETIVLGVTPDAKKPVG